MYTLYYSPGACSMAVHVLLNELGVPYEAEQVEIHGQKSPELLNVNPRGAVPVLIDNGEVIREGAAIILHLLEKHPSSFLPRDGKARAGALEWLMFANATLHPAYGRMFFLMRNVQDPKSDPLCKATGEQINKLWQEVDAELGKRRFIAGDDCTAADILLSVIANWSPGLPVPVAFGPNVKRMFQEVTARPAYQKTLEQEQVDYKVAA